MKSPSPIETPSDLVPVALSEGAQIAKELAETQKPRTVNMTDSELLLLPKTMTYVNLTEINEKHLQAPSRRKGNIQLSRLPSFIEYANRFKSDASIVLLAAEVEDNDITARARVVFNAPPKGAELDKAGHGDFTATYDFPVSKDLKTWLESNDRAMNQVTFASFIEDNSVDLADPHSVFGDNSYEAVAHLEKALQGKGADPITMVELSRGLEVRVKEQIKNFSRLPSGEVALQYTVEHEGTDGQPLKLPSWFVVNVPIFEGGPRHPFVVRLRYRVSEGRVTFSYVIYRLQATFDEALDMSAQLIKKETDLPLFEVELSATVGND